MIHKNDIHIKVSLPFKSGKTLENERIPLRVKINFKMSTFNWYMYLLKYFIIFSVFFFKWITTCITCTNSCLVCQIKKKSVFGVEVSEFALVCRSDFGRALQNTKD